jgi:hypothetical protein
METEDEKKSITIMEALNEYYALKNRYETNNYEKYIKPIILSKKSKREKKIEYSKLPKYPCINCKRNVGTIFNVIADNKNNKRTFISKCGDLSSPCQLNINIDVNNIEDINKELEINIKDMEKCKLDLIKAKNDAFFFENSSIKGYNLSIKKFTSITQELKLYSEVAGSLIEENILIKYNPIRNELLEKALIEFGQGYLLPFKDMIKEYLEKNDEQLVNNAVKFYINEMVPKLKEIQELKYKVNYVAYDEEDSTYNLVQMKNPPEANELLYESDYGKINSFIKGVSDIVKEKKIRPNKRNSENEGIMETSKTKTLKLKPKLSEEFISIKPKKSKTKKQKKIELIEEVEDVDDLGEEVEQAEEINPILSSDPSPMSLEFNLSQEEPSIEEENMDDIFGPSSSEETKK